MSIARKSALDATTQIVSLFVSLAASIVLSRSLGDDGRGAYILATLVAHQLLVGFGEFGLRTSCQVFVARQPKDLARLHTFAVLFSLAVGGAGGLLLLLAGAWVRGVLLEGLQMWTLLLIVAAFPVLLYQVAWRGLLIGLGDIRRRALLDFALAVASASAIVLLIAWLPGKPVNELILAYYGVIVLGALAMYATLRPHGRLWAVPSWKLSRSLLGYARWVYFGNLAATLRGQIDQLLVNFAGGFGALGLYNQASSLSRRSLILPEALVASSYQPITAAESKESARLVAAAFRQVTLIGLAVTLAGWLMAPLIPVIFGSDFAGSVWPFRVLLPAICLLGASRVLAIYFTGHLANPRIPAVINWLTVGIQFASCLLLASRFGTLAGITYGTAIACMATVAFFSVEFLRRPETPGCLELIRWRREDVMRWVELARRLRSPAS